MIKRTRIGVRFTAVVLLLTAPVGCTGDDRPEGDRPTANKTGQAAEADKPVIGSFVGKVSGTKAFVAVVAAAAQEGQDDGAVQIYLSDGRGLSEWFSGSITDGGFAAESDDGDAETEGTLTGDSVTGTVVLPGGKTGEFEASPPSGAAGLYELKVSAGGELTGASAAGLFVKGVIKLRKGGTGMLRLVDGTRLEFALTRKRAGDLAHLRAGQVRLIVLPDGALRGVAKARPVDAGDFGFFMRST